LTALESTHVDVNNFSLVQMITQVPATTLKNPSFTLLHPPGHRRISRRENQHVFACRRPRGWHWPAIVGVVCDRNRHLATSFFFNHSTRLWEKPAFRLSGAR